MSLLKKVIAGNDVPILTDLPAELLTLVIRQLLYLTPSNTRLYALVGLSSVCQLLKALVSSASFHSDSILFSSETHCRCLGTIHPCNRIDYHGPFTLNIPSLLSKRLIGSFQPQITDAVTGDLAQFLRATSIQHLALSRFSNLTVDSLSELLPHCSHLQSLDLSHCKQLHTLPESLGQLTALRSLDLSGCSSLHTLPESLGQLTALRSLDLWGCSSLHTLPESLGQLTALRSLDLSFCLKLRELPNSVAKLPNLHISG